MAKHGGIKDSGEYFVITPASRKVTVPHAHKSVGTVGDHNSEQITFVCPQMVDGHDVSQCARRYITWVNVKGEVGHDELNLSQVEQGEEGMIYLSWTIRNALTVASGIVQFSVHFEDVDDKGATLYRWSTTTCKDCDILESINAVLGAYEAIYVSGDTLVIADYAPVKDNKLSIETNGIIPEGTMKIEKNGSYDVGEVAQVEVAVEGDLPKINVTWDGVIIAETNFGQETLQLSEEHDPDFVARNIREGVNIFGTDGIYRGDHKNHIVTVKNLWGYSGIFDENGKEMYETAVVGHTYWDYAEGDLKTEIVQVSVENPMQIWVADGSSILVSVAHNIDHAPLKIEAVEDDITDYPIADGVIVLLDITEDATVLLLNQK